LFDHLPAGCRLDLITSVPMADGAGELQYRLHR
jgi:hypothetical protein